MILEETERIAEDFIKSRPNTLLKEVNDNNAGIGLVLKLLLASESGTLTAGEISEAMGVSTARVAVLLKKMERQGLIVKRSSREDARVTVVSLSEEGTKRAKEMKRLIFEKIASVIDRIGIDKFRQFIALSIEVKNAIGEDFPPNPDM